MKLTSKHKLYGAVLGVCGAALMFDKAFLGPSEAAAESTLADLVVSSDPLDQVPAGQPVLADAGTRMRNRTAVHLRTIADQGELDLQNMRNAFVADVVWVPPANAEAVIIDAGSPAELFLKSHSLNAVMASSDGGYAIVDGRGMRLGDMVDGFALVKVEEGAAIFSSTDGLLIELMLDGSADE